METKKNISFVKPFLWWGIGVVTIIGAYWGIVRFIYKSNCFTPWLEPNEFGDMFGFLSCLFSGLAFAGLIVTIRQQKEDLELQRQELKRANNEAAEQTEQFEEQTKQLREQLELARSSQIKDDFYRRLTLLKQQESEIVYRWKEYKWNSSEQVGCKVTGFEAIEKYYANILQRPLHINNKSWLDSHPCSCEAFRVWMRSFFTLVTDIMTFYKNEEQRQFYIRILIESTSIPMRGILYHDYVNLNIQSVEKAMAYLEAKKFIDPDTFPDVT